MADGDYDPDFGTEGVDFHVKGSGGNPTPPILTILGAIASGIVVAGFFVLSLSGRPCCGVHRVGRDPPGHASEDECAEEKVLELYQDPAGYTMDSVRRNMMKRYEERRRYRRGKCEEKRNRLLDAAIREYKRELAEDGWESKEGDTYYPMGITHYKYSWGTGKWWEDEFTSIDVVFRMDVRDEQGKALGISAERTVRFKYHKGSSLEECWFGGEGFEPGRTVDIYHLEEGKAPGSVRLMQPGRKRGRAPPRHFRHEGRRGAPGTAQLPGGGKTQRMTRRAC